MKDRFTLEEVMDAWRNGPSLLNYIGSELPVYTTNTPWRPLAGPEIDELINALHRLAEMNRLAPGQTLMNQGSRFCRLPILQPVKEGIQGQTWSCLPISAIWRRQNSWACERWRHHRKHRYDPVKRGASYSGNAVETVGNQ